MMIKEKKQYKFIMKDQQRIDLIVLNLNFQVLKLSIIVNKYETVRIAYSLIEKMRNLVITKAFSYKQFSKNHKFANILKMNCKK